MKLFIKKLFVFLIVFFVFDKLFYLFLFISPTLEYDNRLEKVMKGEINKDIIVIGSSRGARNIIAGQIEDSLGLSSYNLSYPGSDIEFHAFLLNTLLKYNKKPKMVLLAIDNPELLILTNHIGYRYDRLYPLAKYNYINNEMVKRNKKSFLSFFLCLSRISKSNFNFSKKKKPISDAISDCGSMPIPFQKEGAIFTYDTVIKQYSASNELENKVSAFIYFQKICIENGIKLYLVFSPNFKTYNNSFEKRIKELTDKKVDFIVYDTLNVLYKNKLYYYDAAHLQSAGAEMFTNEIIKML
jgi:hypothetical protein